jgi:hypothetical protein
MILYCHHQSSFTEEYVVQHDNVIACLKFFSASSYRHPFWCGSLRTTCLISTITTIILHPIGSIIGVIGRDGWGRGVHSRRWSKFGVDGDLLACLPFFIRVTKDDTFPLLGGPRSSRLSSSKSLRANSSSRVMSGRLSSLLEERFTTEIPSEDTLCS